MAGKVEQKVERMAKPKDTGKLRGAAVEPSGGVPVSAGITSPFSKSPVASVGRPKTSALTKMGVAAVGLIVVIVTYLVPEIGRSDLTEITPTIAAAMPAAKVDLALKKPTTPVTQPKAPVVAAKAVTEPAPASQPASQPPSWKDDYVAELTAGTVAALRREAILPPPPTPDLASENLNIDQPEVTQALTPPGGFANTAGIVAILSGKE